MIIIIEAQIYGIRPVAQNEITQKPVFMVGT